MGHPLLGSCPLALTSSISLRNERKALFHTGDTLLGWRNGRRVRLRGVWGNLWGFESPPEHHFSLQIDTRQGNWILSSRAEVLILYFERTWSHVPALALGNRAGTCLLQDPVLADPVGASRHHESNSRFPWAQKRTVAPAVLKLRPSFDGGLQSGCGVSGSTGSASRRKDSRIPRLRPSFRRKSGSQSNRRLSFREKSFSRVPPFPV